MEGKKSKSVPKLVIGTLSLVVLPSLSLPASALLFLALKFKKPIFIFEDRKNGKHFLTKLLISISPYAAKEKIVFIPVLYLPTSYPIHLFAVCHGSDTGYNCTSS